MLFFNYKACFFRKKQLERKFYYSIHFFLYLAEFVIIANERKEGAGEREAFDFLLLQ